MQASQTNLFGLYSHIVGASKMRNHIFKPSIYTIVVLMLCLEDNVRWSFTLISNHNTLGVHISTTEK